MNLNIRLNHHQQKCIITAILCGLQTLLFSRNLYLSIAVTLLQIFHLIYLLVCRKIIDAIVMFTIFLSMSLEFEYTTGAFYGLKSFRILGITIAVWIIFVLFCATIIHCCYHRSTYAQNTEAHRTLKEIITLNTIAIAMGFLMIIFNDNSVAEHNGVLSAFFLEFYTVLTLVTIPAVIIGCFSSYEEFRLKMRTAIHSVLVVIIVQQYLSLLLGITGNVTGQEVPLVSSIQLYGPFLALYFVYKNQEYHKFLTIMGFLGWIISFRYSQGSGQYIMLFSIPVWIIIITVKRKEINTIIKVVAASMFLLPAMFYLIFSGHVAVQYKLEQAISLLNIKAQNWRALLPMSPRVRIEELIDIFIEYSHKPHLSLFGKGIMGTIKDYTGFFAASQWALGTSAFSNFEWNAGAYFSVHETINKLLLSNGILGAVFLGRTLVKGVKNIKKNPLIVIGLMWLIWYWGYSTTISWFGMVCLMVGFSEATMKTKSDIIEGTKCGQKNTDNIHRLV